MKMEDKFNLPVSVGWLSNLFDELSPQQKQAAAHAINCHDELVDLLGRIYAGGPVSNMEIHNLLQKSKGEQQSLSR